MYRFSLMPMIDYSMGWVLDRRAKKLLNDGLPQFVVFSHDFIGTRIALHGYYERNYLDVVSGFLSEKGYIDGGDDFIDIGANIGNHSLYFANKFRKVISIEASPSIYKVLSVNSCLAPNIYPMNIALGNVNGTVAIRVCRFNRGGSKIVKEESLLEGLESENVDVCRIDDLQIDLSNVAVVKIDVEDMESEVLKGGWKFFSSIRPVVLFEQQPNEFRDGKPSATLQLLQELNYDIYYIHQKPSSPEHRGRVSVIKYLILGFFFGFSLRVKKIRIFERNIWTVLWNVNCAAKGLTVDVL